LTGHDLTRHGLEQGPLFKILLDRLRELQLEGQIQSKREALDWVDRYLRTDAGPPSDQPEPT
jgi:hypothetical protein